MILPNIVCTLQFTGQMQSKAAKHTSEIPCGAYLDTHPASLLITALPYNIWNLDLVTPHENLGSFLGTLFPPKAVGVQYLTS